jgi:c-di-GMP-binding flagellar brake protein YcgR
MRDDTMTMDMSESAWVELPDLERDAIAADAPNTLAPADKSALPRRSPLREIASWRVLKMWEDGASLTDAVTVKLIGVHEGHSIIVTTPDASKGLMPNNGALYRFRSFSGESIYEFSALLLKQCDEPYPYLHLAWPLERHVQNRDLRAAVRVKTELPCMVYPGAQANGKFAKGTITNLSTGGAAIRLSDELAVFYDEVRVVFRLAVADQEVLVEAKARPVRKPEETPERVMGVSFSGLQLAEKLALHAFVHTALVRELEVPLYAN